MSTETITRRASHAVLAGQARETWNRARGIGRELPYARRKAVTDASWELADALEFYRLIHTGQIPPLVAYEGLKYQPESRRYQRALQQAADDALEEAAELVKVVREHCGDEVARRVSGENGGAGR